MKPGRMKPTAPSGQCRACGMAFERHDGLQRTCQSVQEMKRAFAVLRTWLTFRDGERFDRQAALDLIRKHLP